MIIPDLNLVLYAHVSSDPGIAQRVMVGWITDRPRDGRYPTCGVRRIHQTGDQSRSSIAADDRRGRDGLVKEWFEHPHLIRLDSGPDHFAHMGQCLEAAGRAGKLVTDAHLAALALDHDAEIHSADRDFRLFPNVRLRNPL